MANLAHDRHREKTGLRSGMSPAKPMLMSAIGILLLPLLGLLFVANLLGEAISTRRWPTRIDETGD